MLGIGGKPFFSCCWGSGGGSLSRTVRICRRENQFFLYCWEPVVRSLSHMVGSCRSFFSNCWELVERMLGIGGKSLFACWELVGIRVFPILLRIRGKPLFSYCWGLGRNFLPFSLCCRALKNKSTQVENYESDRHPTSKSCS